LKINNPDILLQEKAISLPIPIFFYRDNNSTYDNCLFSQKVKRLPTAQFMYGVMVNILSKKDFMERKTVCAIFLLDGKNNSCMKQNNILQKNYTS
jgi:hypothetical protein